MFWVFNEEGEPRLLEPEELPYPIEIVDSVTKDTIRIETRSCTKAHKTLGVMETPNGDYKPETDRLIAKANKFARKATLMSVSERDATTLYFSMIHSSMRYSATAQSTQVCAPRWLVGDGLVSTRGDSFLRSSFMTVQPYHS
jgi:hypothetical protein